MRARGGDRYRFHGLPPWLSKPIVRFVHFVMERKQLLEIARRVEATSSKTVFLRKSDKHSMPTIARSV